jgi:hypothetical protein
VALWVVLLGSAFAAIATARVVVEGESRLSNCDAALRKQDFAEATVEARAAALLYAPGAPHVEAAYARLLHVARTTEANGDKESALFAWRAMRGAAIDTKSLFTAHDRERDMADIAIARLTADAPRPMMSRDTTPEQAEKHMRDLLAREDAPRAGWVLALVVGFAAMIGGLVTAIARGLDAPRFLERARVPLAISAAGVVIYVMAAIR